jgi:hypothetical protein
LLGDLAQAAIGIDDDRSFDDFEQRQVGDAVAVEGGIFEAEAFALGDLSAAFDFAEAVAKRLDDAVRGPARAPSKSRARCPTRPRLARPRSASRR